MEKTRKGRPGKLTDADIKERVRRAMQDTFKKHLSVDEMNVIKVAGQTLLEKLLADNTAVANEEKDIKFGKHYTRERVAEYSRNGHVCSVEGCVQHNNDDWGACMYVCLL